MNDSNEAIAVVGMACRMPAARNTHELWWKVLKEGKDCIGDGKFPRRRAEDIQHVMHVFEEHLTDKSNPFFNGGWFESVDEFDAQFFNVPAAEVPFIEPEQRIFLELVHEALEDSGYAAKIHGSNTGVYVGHTFNKYRMLLTENHPSASHGNHSPFIFGRISYVYNLQGPGMMVCTGCSSSLLAVHVAAQAILGGECEMAIAGGVSLDLLPIDVKTDIWNQLGITGPGVKCRVFDDTANGIVKGEGSGVVILKKLSSAIADGDHIYGVLLSTAANHDGTSNGITAPNPLAQAELLRKAWRTARVSPRDISYIEAHGTGTRLGDPIEVKGMTLAFRDFTEDERFCRIGSIKSNVGHLADGAAGVVGLIKVLLSFHFQQLPPSIHCHALNSAVDWTHSPVVVNTKLREWESVNGNKRLAGVSAFGLLGTNVHTVVQEYKNVNRKQPQDSRPTVLALAALTLKSLVGTLERFSQYYTEDRSARTQENWKQFCFSVNTGRRQAKLPFRAIICAQDWPSAAKYMEDLILLMRPLYKLEGGEFTLEECRQKCEACGSKVNFATTSTQKIRSTNTAEVVHAFLQGKIVDFDYYYSSARYERLPMLPSYFFDQKRYWPDTTKSAVEQHLLSLTYTNQLLCTNSNGTPSSSSPILLSPSLPVIGNAQQHKLTSTFINSGNLHSNDTLHLNGNSKERDLKPTSKNLHSNGALTTKQPKLDVRTIVSELLNKLLGHEVDWEPDNNLFEAGMDSLIATQLMEGINGVVGVRLNAFSVHMAETFEKLVELIENSAAKLEIKTTAPDPKAQYLAPLNGTTEPETKLPQPTNKRGDDITHRHNNFPQGIHDIPPLAESTTGEYPASAQQRGLWLLQQRDPTHIAYNVGNCLVLRGPLDTDLFVRCVEAVVEEQDVFRTVFSNNVQDNQIYQQVDNNMHLSVQVLPSVTPSDCDQLAKRRAPLLEAALCGKSRLIAHFGGQGVQYFDELVQLYNDQSKGALSTTLLAQSCELLLQEYSTPSSQTTNVHAFGIDLKSWLDLPHTRPNQDYLTNPAISFPLIFVTQMMTYARVLDMSGLPHELLKTMWRGAIGHSQGAAAAVVVSLSATNKNLLENSKRMLQFMFWLGTRCAQHNLAERPCMLSIALTKEQVTEKIQGYKSVSVSLINSKSSVVVSGNPTDIEELKNTLSKSGIATREVNVRVPFHSPHLATTLRSLADDLRREGLWNAFRYESLSFPVTFAEAPHESLLYALAEHICLRPVDWIAQSTQVTKLNGSHVVDFGPGTGTGSNISQATMTNLADTNVVLAPYWDLFVKSNSEPSSLKTPEVLAQKFLDCQFTIPFDLSRGPLARFILGKIEEHVHFFCVVLHHIIWDGGSHFLFYNDVWRRYKSYTSPQILREPRMTYIDFCRYQNNLISNNTEMQEDMTFWQEYLRDVPTTTIPGDKPRPVTFSFKGEKHTYTIPPTVHEIQAKFPGTTLYQFLLSTLYVLLYKMTSQTDLVVAAQVANRPTGSRHTLGFFVNALPFRITLDPLATFAHLLREVKGSCAKALAHQHVPFDSIVAAVDVPRDPSVGSPLFNILLNLHTAELQGDHENPPSNLHTVRLVPHDSSCKWDLYFDFLQEEGILDTETKKGGLVLRVNYYRDLYSAELIDHTIRCWMEIMTSLMVNPSQPLFQTILRPQHSPTLFPQLTTPQFVPQTSLVDWIMFNAHRFPDRVAISGNPSITYSQLEQDAKQLASFICNQVKPEACVGVVAQRASAKTSVMIVACLFAGRPYVLLDATQPELYVAKQCNAAGCSLLLSEDLRAEVFEWHCPQVNTIICINSTTVSDTTLMSEQLWDHVAKTPVAENDTIVGPGWVNSYDGAPFSQLELLEFCNNVEAKLKPYVREDSTVLEIGCASGLSLRAIAPLIPFGKFVATDLSQNMLDLVQALADSKQWTFVETQQMTADSVAQTMTGRQFDIIILNSVVQYFPDYNYLRNVIRQCESLLSSGGILFLGDVLDLARKKDLIDSLHQYKKLHAETTVINSWEGELFVPTGFLQDICKELQLNLATSIKIHSVENELTKFRYDAILEKIGNLDQIGVPNKLQFSWSDVQKHKTNFKPPQRHQVVCTHIHPQYNQQVKLNHEQLVHYVEWAVETYNLSGMSNIGWELSAPNSEFSQLFAGLAAGCTVVPYSLQDGVANNSGMIRLTPTQLSHLLSSSISPLPFTSFLLHDTEEHRTHPQLLNNLLKHQQDRPFVVHIEHLAYTYPLGVLYASIERCMLPLQTSFHEILFNPTFVEVKAADDSGEDLPIGFFGCMRIAPHKSQGVKPTQTKTRVRILPSKLIQIQQSNTITKLTDNSLQSLLHGVSGVDDVCLWQVDAGDTQRVCATLRSKRETKMDVPLQANGFQALLEHAPPSLNLPFDHKPKHDGETNSSWDSLPINIHNKLSSENVLCVWIALVARITAEKNVVICLQQESEMIPVHLEIPENFTLLQESLRHALQKSREANRNTPFSRVAEHFKKLPSLSQVFFASSPPTSQFQLGVIFSETSSYISSLSLCYSSSLFTHKSINRMAHAFSLLAQQCILHPSSPLGSLSIVSQEELSQLVKPISTKVELEPILVSIEKQARLSPNAIAVTCDGNSITYRELDLRATLLSAQIRARCPQDVPVGVLLPRSIDLVVTFYAILKAGVGYVPIDPRFPAARVAHYLHDSGAQVVITTRGIASSLLSSFNGVAMCYEDSKCTEILCGNYQHYAQKEGRQSQGSQLFCVIYTSGSTGTPKGVMLDHTAVQNVFAYLTKVLKISEQQQKVFLGITTVSFDIACVEMFLPLVHGWTIALADDDCVLNPNKLAAFIDANRPSILQTTPTRWQLLLDAHWIPNKDMTLIAAGELLPNSLAHALLVNCKTLFNGYGPSETTIYSTFFECTLERDVCIGSPLDNYFIYILTEEGAHQPIGVPGEVYIGGVGVSKGYCGNTDGKHRFINNNPFGTGRLYKTGDMACWNEDGTLKYLGRNDLQVKIHGCRIEVEEIEHVLCLQSAVQSAVVVVHNNSLVAFVVLHSPTSSTALKRAIGKLLPQWMVPQSIVIVKELPLTANNKTDRKKVAEMAERADWMSTAKFENCVISDRINALLSPYLPKSLIPDHTLLVDEQPSASEMPTIISRLEKRHSTPDTSGDPIVAQIRSIFTQLLPGNPNPSLDDNFFDLGGDSILCIRLAHALEQCKLYVDITSIFNNPTIRNLRAIVQTTETSTKATKTKSHFKTGKVWAPPIAQEFFHHNPVSANHYVLPALLTFPQQINLPKLQAALTSVIYRHQSLRTCFLYKGSPASIRVLPSEQAKFETKTFSFSFNPSHPSVSEIEGSLSLSEGRNVALAIYGDNQALVVVHHLCVDVLSWGILLDEISHFYSGRKESDLPRPDSFEKFCSQLQSESTTTEINYWKEVGAKIQNSGIVPVATKIDSAQRLYKNSRIAVRELDSTQTKQAIAAASVVGCQFAVEMMVCVGRALSQIHKSATTAICIENHGRDSFIDLGNNSRLAGYVAARFPFVLNTPASGSCVEQAQAVAHELQTVPSKGAGYGMLRFFGKGLSDGEISIPQVMFAHLGTLGTTSTYSAFSCVPWSVIMIQELLHNRFHRHQEERKIFSIEIFSWIYDNKLTVACLYESKEYTKETVDHLLDLVVAELISFLKLGSETALTTSTNEINNFAKLIAIWEIVFPGHKITSNSHFFEMGGTSISAHQLCSLLLSELSVRVPVQALYRNPRLSQFSGMISQLPIEHSDPKKLPTLAKEYIPLATSAEKRMIFLQESSLTSSYTETIIWCINRYTMVEVRDACYEVLKSHPELSVVFSFDKSGQVLKTPLLPHNISYMNWEHFSLPNRSSIYSELKHLPRRIFSILEAKEALYNLRYYEDSSEHNSGILVAQFHHSIADAATFALFERDLFRVLSNNNLALQTTIISPGKDDIEYFKSEVFDTDKQFWESVFEEPSPSAPMLPFDYPREQGDANCSSQTGSAQVSLPLDANIASQISSVCAELGITKFHYAIACYLALMHFYTNESDLVVCVPVSIRSPQTRSAGMFVNTIPFRFMMPEKEMSVREFLLRVSESFITAHAHARYPFEHIKTTAEHNNTPLSALMWTLFNYEDRADLPLERVHVPPVDSKLDLSMDIVVTKSGWTCVAEYKPTLFSNATIKRLTGNFLSLLVRFSTSATNNIYEIPYINYQETNVLLANSKWRSSEPRVLSVPVHRNFEQFALAHPKQIAVRCGEHAVTYETANELSNHVASQIAGWDEFNPSVPVILLCSRDENVLPLMLGVWKSGGFFVPLSSHTRNRLDDILAASGANLIITNMEGVEAKSAVVWKMSELKARQLKSVPLAKSSSTAYTIYTSGSTGVPKPCTITHANLQTMIHAWRVDYQIEKLGSDKVRVLQWAPFSFDVFLADVMRANFCAAGTLVICPEDKRLDTEHVANLVQKSGATLLEVTPQFAVSMLTQHSSSYLSSLHLLVVGSDTINCTEFNFIQSKLQGFGVRVVNSYGLSEATADSCFFDGVACTYSGTVPIGKPMTNVQVYILDRYGRTAPIGGCGEICLGGPAVGLQNGATTVFFHNNAQYKLLRTNDIGRWSNKGDIEFLGRNDRTTKVRGFRVNESDIEKTILRLCEDVVRAVYITIVSHATTKGNKTIVAFVVLKQPHADSRACDEIRSRTKQMPSYSRPEVLHVMENIPLTPHGKVDRKILVNIMTNAALEKKSQINQADSSVLTNEEKLVAKIWTDTFGSEPDLDKGFLEQGDSLSLMQFHAILQGNVSVKISITVLLSYPSIKELARHLSSLIQTPQQIVSNPTSIPPPLSLPPSSQRMAIVGVALNLPNGVNTLAALAHASITAQDTVRALPETRREDFLTCCDAALAQRLRSIPTIPASFLDRVDLFCPEFFSISPGEASMISPEQRLLLMICTEAVADAGLLHTIYGSNTGVFMATAQTQYDQICEPDPISVPGLLSSVMPSRVAYTFDLHGPAMVVDTACSSGLAAIQLAAESIVRGECKQAIVAGVHLMLYPAQEGVFGIGTISPDGHCRAFDASSKGTGMGEGSMALVIKPLESAIKDGDHVYGVWEGGAMNNTGRGSSITAPKALAQEDTIRKTLEKVGLQSHEVQYIEAHGTGTVLGDKVEVEALKAVFSAPIQLEPPVEAAPLYIGSAKSTFGHTDSAAGLLGIMRVLAAFQIRQVLPSAHCATPHPELCNFVKGNRRVQVAQNPHDWKSPRKVAGVSSFGLSGTNCHAIISHDNTFDESEQTVQTNLPLFLQAPSFNEIQELCHDYIYMLSTIQTYPQHIFRNISYTTYQDAQLSTRLSPSHKPTFSITLHVLSISHAIELLKAIKGCQNAEALKNMILQRHTNITLGNATGDFDKIFATKHSRVNIPRKLFALRRFWPKQQQKTSTLVRKSSLNIEKLLHKARGYTRELVRSLPLDTPKGHPELLLRFCNSIISILFKQHGVQRDFVGTEQELFDRLGFIPKYFKFYHTMVRSMLEEGVFRKSSNGILSIDPSLYSHPDSDPDSLCLRGTQAYPIYADCFRFPLYVSSYLSPVLKGEMSPISVIYPKGNLFFVEQNYTRLGDPLGDVYYNMYCQLICRFAKRMAASRSAENPLRILECGAGMGLVTRQLLPKLKKINGNFQYYFTDLGKAFVENARKTFSAEFPFVQYSVFDITKPPETQGLLGQFDLIVSYNVIHTTGLIHVTFGVYFIMLMKVLGVDKLDCKKWVWGIHKFKIGQIIWMDLNAKRETNTLPQTNKIGEVYITITGIEEILHIKTQARDYAKNKKQEFPDKFKTASRVVSTLNDLLFSLDVGCFPAAGDVFMVVSSKRARACDVPMLVTVAGNAGIKFTPSPKHFKDRSAFRAGRSRSRSKSKTRGPVVKNDSDPLSLLIDRYSKEPHAAHEEALAQAYQERNAKKAEKERKAAIAAAAAAESEPDARLAASTPVNHDSPTPRAPGREEGVVEMPAGARVKNAGGQRPKFSPSGSTVTSYGRTSTPPPRTVTETEVGPKRKTSQKKKRASDEQELEQDIPPPKTTSSKRVRTQYTLVAMAVPQERVMTVVDGPYPNSARGIDEFLSSLRVKLSNRFHRQDLSSPAFLQYTVHIDAAPVNLRAPAPAADILEELISEPNALASSSTAAHTCA